MLSSTDKNALRYLCKKDKILGAYIEKLGVLSFNRYDSPFEALVCSVIAQQVSNSAANAIRQRVAETFGAFSAEKFKNATEEQLKNCGLSARKADYILGIIKLANSGKLEYEKLDKLSDDEITQTLLKIKGVGRWTVQMLFIFCFCRENITSFDDFGIRHGIMNLYCLKELSEEKFNRLAKRWSPYKTTASLYLWQAAVDIELERARKEKFNKKKKLRTIK